MSFSESSSRSVLPELYYDLFVYWTPVLYGSTLATIILRLNDVDLSWIREISKIVDNLPLSLDILVIVIAFSLVQLAGLYVSALSHYLGVFILELWSMIETRKVKSFGDVSSKLGEINETFLLARKDPAVGIVMSKLLAKFGLMVNTFFINLSLCIYAWYLGSAVTATVVTILTLISFMDSIRRWTGIRHHADKFNAVITES